MSRFKGKLAPAAISALNCIVLSLLFPYHLGVWLVLLAAVATSILLFFLSRRYSSRRALRRLLLAAAVFVLVSAAALGLVGPLMVQPAPTYVFFAPEWNPLKSHIVEAPPGAPSVVVFADPLRKALRRFWQRLAPYRVRLLEYDERAGGFLVFPMHGARLDSSTLPAGTAARHLSIDALIPEVVLDLQKPGSTVSSGNLKVMLQFGLHRVLSVEGHTNGIAGWNAILAKLPPTDSELVYAATLDAALSLLVFGTYPVALSTLETASTLAPSAEERVRVLCMIGAVVSQLISGNLGKFQSLAVYNAAYKSLPRSVSAEMLQGQPALAWSVKQLSNAYGSSAFWAAKWGQTPNVPRNPYQSRSDKLAVLLPSDPQSFGPIVPRRVADEMDHLLASADRLKEEPESAHDLAVAALDKFAASVNKLTEKTPAQISYGLGPEVPILRTVDLDDGQFLKAAEVAERDPNTAFRFVEQAIFDFMPTTLSRPGSDIQARLSELRRITLAGTHASVRDGLLQRLDWLQAMALYYGTIKADNPTAALENLMRGDPHDALLDQVPCVTFMRITLLFLAVYGPWDKGGSLPPGYPPPVMPLPDDVRDWWDPRFLASVCYRLLAMVPIAEAKPATPELQDTLESILGSPRVLMSDRRGRVFIPWKLLIAAAEEKAQTYEFDELREELETELGLRYSEIIGSDSSAY